MAELSIQEMDQQSVAVLPERAALGVVKFIKVNAYNSATAYQFALLSKNTANASQVIIVG
jgi:hypothetical protein